MSTNAAMLSPWRFPFLTPGYFPADCQHDPLATAPPSPIPAELTNNARAFALFWAGAEEIGAYGVLPQRVPRPEFFAEIIRLEDQSGNEQIGDRAEALRQRLRHLVESELRSTAVNWDRVLLSLGMALRFGLNRELVAWSESFSPQSADIAARLASIRLTAHLNDCLATEQPADLAEAKTLAEAAQLDKLDPWIRLAVLGKLVVARFRYGKVFGPGLQPLVGEDVLREVSHLTETLVPNSFRQTYLLSTTLRGLAFWGDGAQKALMRPRLERSLALATDLPQRNAWETVLRADLMLTTRQSLAKLLLHEGLFTEAEEQLRAMSTTDDPRDATTHGELGFFLQRSKRLEDAIPHFLKAAELGPPSVAMHHYFAGQCLSQTARKEDALHQFTLSVNADDQALSPLCAMIELHLAADRPRDARILAEQISADPNLRSQVDEQDALLLKRALA